MQYILPREPLNDRQACVDGGPLAGATVVWVGSFAVVGPALWRGTLAPRTRQHGTLEE